MSLLVKGRGLSAVVRPSPPGILKTGRVIRFPGLVGGDLKTGDLVTGGIKIGELTTGGLVTGGINIGDLIIGGLDTGKLDIGGLDIGDLIIGGLDIGKLEIGGLDIGKLDIGKLKTGKLRIGGLHIGGLNGDGKATGRGAGSRAPVYRPIVCGAPVEGMRTLAVEWAYDDWGRMTRTTGVWKAEVNGHEWTPETWAGLVAESGDMGGNYGRGTLGVATADQLRWVLDTVGHSHGCDVKFDRPDPTGKILQEEIVTRMVSSGDSGDEFVRAEPGRSRNPAYSQAWLTP